MTDRPRVLLAVVPLVIAAACGQATTPGSPAGPAAASRAVAESAAVPSGPSIPSSPASPDVADSTAVRLDESLLAVLPADVDGAAVSPEPDSFASAASDPDFARNVESAAFAVVSDGSDLASGVVAKLRPGRYSDAFFRDWRDSYNQGACAQAGGLSGNAEAQLGGRTVYVATCAGGMRVYHAWLPEREAVVSLFSIGGRAFGEQLMAGLRP